MAHYEPIYSIAMFTRGMSFNEVQRSFYNFSLLTTLASILKLNRIPASVPMSSASAEYLVEAIDEVLAWSSLFNDHMDMERVLRNLQVKSSISSIYQAIENTPHLCVEDDVVFSDKHGRNLNIQHSKELASKHFKETMEVLSILNSCKQITGLALTGSVAAGMNKDDGDVDVMIITKPGWVWRVRALAVYLSHKHPGGHLLCPNMVLSEEALRFEKTVYTAREMMQIIPIKDSNGITKLYDVNDWVKEVLPNAEKKPLQPLSEKRDYPWWWRIMKLPLLGQLAESWEAQRRIKQLKSTSTSDEAFYSKSVCRGHENSHKTRIEAEYQNALEAIS